MSCACTGCYAMLVQEDLMEKQEAIAAIIRAVFADRYTYASPPSSSQIRIGNAVLGRQAPKSRRVREVSRHNNYRLNGLLFHVRSLQTWQGFEEVLRGHGGGGLTSLTARLVCSLRHCFVLLRFEQPKQGLQSAVDLRICILATACVTERARHPR